MAQPQPVPQIEALPPYVPGARGVAGTRPPVKVSSNENPTSPLPSVVEAVHRAGETINRYPDMFAVELTERLAARHGVRPENVVTGGGSVGVLAHLLQAFAGPGDEVLFAWRSFEAYPILTSLAGATPVTVPVDADARHDLAALAAAITERTKVVMVCSPNNPTGPAVGAAEFEEFMASVPERVLVVLDEAYVEYVTDPSAVQGEALLGRYDNLLVLRTFSKAYGLAGLRVGYAVGPESIVTAVRKAVTPFSVSTVAQVAAIASLDAEDELRERVEATIAERHRVISALAEQGWSVPEAQGNFVWIPAGDRALELAQNLAALDPQVLVRPFSGDGVRITIGSAEDNDAVLVALANLAWRV